MRTTKKILVVDDDPVSRDLLEEVLRKEGLEVHLAESAETALPILAHEDFPLVLSDIRMKEKSGFDLLRETRKLRPNSVIILMTGFGSMEGALDALREGAFDYISKPFQLDDLRSVVARAGKHAEHLRGLVSGPASGRLNTQVAAGSLIGRSPKIVEVYKMLARASLTSSNVFISGETGTGKALVARTIHDNGARKGKPFFKLSNSEDLRELENDLSLAEGGTVFIEELLSLGSSEQSRILRILENSELELASEKRGLRWISASRRSVGDLARSGMVRSDLFARLDIISMEIPPLRERAEDIPELVGHFLAKYSEKNEKDVSHLSDSAMSLLRGYAWPGNVRELERIVEKAVALSAGNVLEPEDFPEISGITAKAPPSGASADTAQASLESMERHHIARVLEETGYNKSRASEILGIDRATLYRKAKNYGIDLKGSSK
jgi:DNA-binding NtrC family response regulator